MMSLARSTVRNFVSRTEVVLVTENGNWSIKEDTKNVLEFSKKAEYLVPRSTISSLGLFNKVVHFMSIHPYLDAGGIIVNRKPYSYFYRGNKTIVTWFHFEDSDPRLKYIPQLSRSVDLLHTSCSITKRKLIELGFDAEKIKVIPLGIDLDVFKPVDSKEKSKIRKKLGVPRKKIVIGSFQKDGEGWGDGNLPKHVKGPDIFCKTVGLLAKDYDIHVLLTGPARGYVKKYLKKKNISFTHQYLENYHDIVKYFQALDLYLVTSREEGGPKALLECMATGIPLVSTKVGMVPDVMQNGKHGFIVDPEDIRGLYDNAKVVLDNKEVRDRIINNSFERIKDYTQDKVVGDYHRKMYEPLLTKSD